jgi:hypothetical protein
LSTLKSHSFPIWRWLHTSSAAQHGDSGYLRRVLLWSFINMSFQEVTVDHKAPVPKGYGSLKKGNVYRTGLCRRLTREAGKTLYVVTDGKKSVGLRAPIFILKEVHEKDRETRDDRVAAVARRDNATSNEFEAVLMSCFPKIPRESVGTILKHTLKKSSGRVGRTSKLSLEQKVQLAVRAHVRHSHTNYESLLREPGTNRNTARKMVAKDIDRLERIWQGKPPKGVGKDLPNGEKKETKNNHASSKSSKDDKPPAPSASATKCKRDKNIIGTAQKKVEQKPRRSRLPKTRSSKPKPTLPKGQPTQSIDRSTRRSTRLQPGCSKGCEVLADFFNDEDEPIIISSDDSDQSEQDDIDDVEDELWELGEDSDGFVVSDGRGDSEDDYVPR